MSNLTAALNQLEFVKRHRPQDKAMLLHCEVLVAHFEKEENEAFESDWEAFEARSWYSESLILGGQLC